MSPTKTSKPKRAALYLRCSTGGQHTENQKPSVTALCKARGLHVVAVHEEKISATKTRPQWETGGASATFPPRKP